VTALPKRFAGQVDHRFRRRSRLKSRRSNLQGVRCRRVGSSAREDAISGVGSTVLAGYPLML
jgi:hypothetical protein